MMPIRETSPVIAAYLAELDAATVTLPPDEQFDIRESIEAHIADMIGEREHIDDEEARRIVNHLGPVAAITAPNSTTPIGISEGATQALPLTGAGQFTDTADHTPTTTRAPGYARIAVILAIVTMLAYLFFTPLSLITGVAAFTFGVLGLRAGESRSEAWTGILVGALPLILAAIFAFLGMSIMNTITVQ